MTRQHIQAAINQALHELAPEIESATLDHSRPLREQADLDSYDYLQLMVRLHELLGVEIPERDYADIATIAQLVDYLGKRISV